MKIEMISKAVICATSPLMYSGKPGMKFWEATTLQHRQSMRGSSLIKRVTEGKSTSSKKQGRPEGSCNLKTDKAEHIKQTIKDLSKDFDGKYSDAKILREYLHNTSKGTYYKYKKELKEEIA